MSIVLAAVATVLACAEGGDGGDAAGAQLGCLHGCASKKDQCMIRAGNAYEIEICDHASKSCSEDCKR